MEIIHHLGQRRAHLMSFCLLGASPVTSARRAFTTLTVSDNEATSTSSTCPLSLSLPSTSGTAMRIYTAHSAAHSIRLYAQTWKYKPREREGRGGKGRGWENDFSLCLPFLRLDTPPTRRTPAAIRSPRPHEQQTVSTGYIKQHVTVTPGRP